MPTTRTLRRYDHRLRDLVRSTGDIGHAERRGVPRSTARGWLTSTRAEVVTVDVFDMDVLNLQQEVLALRNRVRCLYSAEVIFADSSPGSMVQFGPRHLNSAGRPR